MSFDHLLVHFRGELLFCPWVTRCAVGTLDNELRYWAKLQDRLFYLGKIPWHTFKPILQNPKAALESKRTVHCLRTQKEDCVCVVM